jgi:hypothetical protein
MPEKKDFKKVLDNTLCGLSNINKDSMDNESSEEEREVSNVFQNDAITNENISNVPSSFNSNILKVKEKEEQK